MGEKPQFKVRRSGSTGEGGGSGTSGEPDGSPNGSDSPWAKAWGWFKSPKGWKGGLGRAILVLIALAVIAAPFSDESADSPMPGDSNSSTDDEAQSGDAAAVPDTPTGSPPTTTRESPAAPAISIELNGSIEFIGGCEDPDGDLDYATWEVKEPGGSEYVEGSRVNLDDTNRTASSTFQFTFSTEGTSTIRWTCFDERGESSTSAWTADVSAPDPVDVLFEEALDAHQGLISSVSENGSRVAFGMEDGDVIVYNEQGTSNHLTLKPDRSVTHLRISEKQNQINIAWMASDLLGALTTSGQDLWAYEFVDVWDVASTTPMETMAAVSQPSEGAGNIGYGVEGDAVWTKELEDSTGVSVAVSKSGELVAVGAGQYWDGLGFVGMSAVQLYDNTGALLWEQETDSDVIEVEINQDQGIVLATTDSGPLKAFDLDGRLLWEEDLLGYAHLSSDGSRVIVGTFAQVIALDTEGNELWRTDVDGGPSEKVYISEDGRRVLALGTGSGDATLLHEGEVIWNATFDGPIGGALSLDGDTWSIIMQNNDTRTTQVYAFRFTE